jgi:hypothetical protein
LGSVLLFKIHQQWKGGCVTDMVDRQTGKLPVEFGKHALYRADIVKLTGWSKEERRKMARACLAHLPEALPRAQRFRACSKIVRAVRSYIHAELAGRARPHMLIKGYARPDTLDKAIRSLKAAMGHISKLDGMGLALLGHLAATGFRNEVGETKRPPASRPLAFAGTLAIMSRNLGHLAEGEQAFSVPPAKRGGQELAHRNALVDELWRIWEEELGGDVRQRKQESGFLAVMPKILQEIDVDAALLVGPPEGEDPFPRPWTASSVRLEAVRFAGMREGVCSGFRAGWDRRKAARAALQ